jgi:phosphoribosylamine--glycine ligase/phosphoribosylformylglycinamidine cyclo-ligase
MSTTNRKILLLGNGGREHALAWKLNQSSSVDKIFVLPGNGGTGNGSLKKVQNVDHIKPNDLAAIANFARSEDIDLVIPGPEAPLVEGIENLIRRAGIRCFGPSPQAAVMEGSKAYAKAFMARHNIPTAQSGTFKDYEAAKEYLQSTKLDRMVIKASGLAAGKGVILPESKEHALQALEDMMVKKELGNAGDEVVIEEYLEGEELSILSFSDGYSIKSLPPAQDHKQIYEGDQGPMTGGMGCYSPTKVATPELVEEIHRTILKPTIDGMRREHMPFVGLLFTGLMITKSGPKVLEYNVRFGDPETQTVLPLLSPETDLAELMLACCDRWLDAIDLKISPGYSATVVAVAGGYPGPYVRGDDITLDQTPADTMIFHAGTTLSQSKLKTAGGRVVAATSTGSTIQEALKRAYEGISTIHFPGMHYRKDIGHRALTTSPTTSDNAPLTYASTGVSISSGNALVKAITPLVASTARPGADASIGGFGGILDLVAAGYSSPPLIVGAIDGIGTKSYIAHEMGVHDSIGIDCVAMNVNDLVVQGAEPLFFLDCYTCGKLDVEVATSFIKGVTKGCIEAGCALVGGETAEMPGLFSAGGLVKDSGNIYDAVGVAVGAVQQGQKLLPDKEGMVVGDVVLGLASNGCHSNGFALIRRIVARAGLKYSDPAPWSDEGQTVGQTLLTPTRIYVKSLLPVVREGLIKGMAHITGGGLTENIPRMLPKHLAATVDVSSYPVPKVFMWLKKEAGLADAEFARTFNTGVGMVLVVKESDKEKVTKELAEKGEMVHVIGSIVEREGEGCILKGLEAWQ